MEVLSRPPDDIRELLDELEYECEPVEIVGFAEPVLVQTIEEIPLELLVLLQSANAEISGDLVFICLDLAPHFYLDLLNLRE